MLDCLLETRAISLLIEAHGGRRDDVNIQVLSPLCIAVMSTTMAPRNTLRPRKRSDPGVSRLRHSRAAQQKLNRSRMLRPEPRRYAARLTREGTTVQLRAAPRTSTLVCSVRDLPVKPQ